MPSRVFYVLLLLLIGCSTTPDRTDADEDSIAARQAELLLRWQQDSERILAEEAEPLATTAEEVIERCIAAMGGRQAFASLQTLSVTSNGHSVHGRFGATRLLKAPNFMRQERDGGRFVVCDGITAWLVEGDRWTTLPSDPPVWQQVFSISLDLIDYAAKNVSYELIGTVGLEGGAFYKLRKTIGAGKEIFVYFDVMTGLLMVEEEFDAYGRKANLFCDYREVGGVLLPHIRVRVADVLELAHVALLSYKANPPLDDALFQAP
jgi:hypothetical protein